MDTLRASDADRERAVAALGRHAEAGRLTADELEERVEQAYAARTVGELEALQRDLPAERSAPPPRPPLALLAVLLVAAGLAGIAVAGHPIAPLFLLAFLAWRLAGRARRRGSTAAA